MALRLALTVPRVPTPVSTLLMVAEPEGADWYPELPKYAMEPAFARFVPFTVSEVEVAPTQPLANKILELVEDEFDLLHDEIATRPAPAKRSAMPRKDLMVHMMK